MSASLEVNDLSVPRGERLVVRGVSLTIPPGRITALIGPNGGGKTTTVEAIGGVLAPSEGSISIDGSGELVGQPPQSIRAAGVAIVPEGHRVLADLTVAESLAVAGYRLPTDQARAGAAEVLTVFPELEGKTARLAGTLSGGEQQMLAIAHALVARPRFLIVDELSFGLAPVVVRRLVEVIRGVADDGVGVLLIEQFADVALEVSTTTYVMEGGKIHHHLPSAELRDKPGLLHSTYLQAGVKAELHPAKREAGSAVGESQR